LTGRRKRLHDPCRLGTRLNPAQTVEFAVDAAQFHETPVDIPINVIAGWANGRPIAGTRAGAAHRSSPAILRLRLSMARRGVDRDPASAWSTRTRCRWTSTGTGPG